MCNGLSYQTARSRCAIGVSAVVPGGTVWGGRCRARSLSVPLGMLVYAVLAVGGRAASGAGLEVTINEVSYHPGDDTLEGEFIELYNYGAEAADLGGWQLSGAVSLSFAPGTILRPGEYLLVAASSGFVAAVYGLDPELFAGNFIGNLDNNGERIELWTDQGYLVSYVDYADSDPWPESADGLGPTLERIAGRLEDDDPRAWAASILVGGTPGAPNSVRLGEPPVLETRTLVAAEDIWSFLPGRDPGPPADWAQPGFDDGGWETGRAGFGYGDGDDNTELLDMRGEYLTVFIRHRFEVEDPAVFEELVLRVDYDDGFVAYLNGEIVASDRVPDPAYDQPASRSHEAGTPVTIRIQDPAGFLVAGTNVLALQGHNQRLDSGDFSLSPSLSGGVLVGEAEPPPDIERPPRDVVINEISSGGAAGGWVELHNRGPTSVDVSGRQLRLFPRALGEFELPPGSSVAPGGFLLISETELGFEIESGHAIILTTADDRWIDALNPRTAPPSLSSGRFPDGDDNRRVFATPTPGVANVAPPGPPIVINEIMYHPADDNTGGEYIELHNAGETPVNLTGWTFTRGVDFAFPRDTEIAPGGYLVLARDPVALETYHGVSGVIGPYEGRLRNDAETLLLRDELKNPVDRVRFADEGGWPESPDGGGPSLELANPRLENRHGAAWRASEGEGTPGAVNSALDADPAPIVVGVEHHPVIPLPGQTVRVLATASDETGIDSVLLFHELVGPGTTDAVLMVDDGVADDGVAGNGIYGAELPGRAAGDIVAFWIEAEAFGGQTVTVPADAPRPAFLYQVEEPVEDGVRPLYRVVMRPSDLTEFRTRSTQSDVLLDVTFVADGQAHYNRGIRLRGNGARNCDPRSYRIQFDHDVSFHGIKRLNLNGCNIHRQWVGLDFLQRTGIPTPRHWFRRIAFNGDIDSSLRLRVESVDGQFLEHNFPGDDNGNLYRGESRANLDYRGEDFDDYRGNYRKVTNEREDDFSDLIDLCRRFDRGLTPAEDFPAALEEAVDTDEWALYFAAFAILGSTENSILLNNGDDYYIYHRPSDGRWLLLPWDLDSVYDEDDQTLFRPTVDAIERYLENRRYAPDYWCDLESLLGGSFQLDPTLARLNHLTGLFGESDLDPLRTYPAARISFLQSHIQSALTLDVISGEAVCNGVLLVGATTVSLEGRAPGCGTTTVEINGEPVSYNPQTTTWTAGDVDLDGQDTLAVVTRYRDGTETARLELDVQPSGAPTPIPTDIAASLTLAAADSPFVASGSVVVQPGAVLTVEPGVTLRFADGASLRVAGQISAVGSDAAPITFRPDFCATSWAGILLLPGSTDSQLQRCELRDATGVDGLGSSLVIEGAAATLRAVDFKTDVSPGGAQGTRVLVREGGDLRLSDVFWSGGSYGVVFESGGGVIRDSRLEALTETALRSFSGAGPEVRIERTIFRDCRVAVAAVNGSLVSANHLTVFGGDTAFLLEGDAVQEEGASLLAQNVIVWETLEPVELDDLSVADITYSCTIGGPLPGSGNISADPLFVDGVAGDFSLRLRSPCRATGAEGTDMGAVPYVPSGILNGFIRSDANGDGFLDIGDPVYTLFYLFRQDLDPPCRSALDSNSDGRLDITDPIYTLEHLFLRGNPPAAPYPACDQVPEEECFIETCP